MIPINHRRLALRNQEEADPHGRADDRQERPGVIDEGTQEQRDEIETKRPSAEKHRQCMETLGW